MPAVPGAPALAALLAAIVAAVTACGEDRPEPSPAPVRLQVLAPDDTAVVRSSSVEVRGTVRPASAEVRVGGREADTARGSWRAEVELRPGGNVVDVTASLGDRPPAVAAVRVVREMPVRVPDVRGLTPAEAQDELAAKGLTGVVRERGGLLDGLLPGEEGVCGTDPDAGEPVRPGSTVELEIAKVC